MLPTQQECLSYAEGLTLDINEEKEFEGENLKEEWIFYPEHILQIIKFSQTEK